MSSPLTIDLTQVATVQLCSELTRRKIFNHPRIRLVPCEFCGDDFPNQKMKFHRRVCPKRPYGWPFVYHACKHCGQQFTARVVREHQPICSENPKQKKAAQAAAAEKAVNHGNFDDNDTRKTI
jgi:hypothetical protein